MYEDLKKIFNPEGSALRNYQISLLNVLVCFDKFCRANDIKYSLHAGTLLGAIRHKGFIPWDDDADVMVTREDFNKIYDIQNTNGKLYKSLSLELYGQGVVPKLVINSIAVDIMIADNVPQNELISKVKKIIAKFFIVLIKAKQKLFFKPHNIKKILNPKCLFWIPVVAFLDFKKLKNFLYFNVSALGECYDMCGGGVKKERIKLFIQMI